MRNIIIFMLVFISGCSADIGQEEVSLPYADSCRETVLKVERIFKKLNSVDDESEFSLEYKLFDVKSIASPDIQGVLSLKYSGSVEPAAKGWSTPGEYLIAVANGIRAECMQDNSIVLDALVDTDYLNYALRGKKNPVVKVVESELVIFYNSGDYQLTE